MCVCVSVSGSLIELVTHTAAAAAVGRPKKSKKVASSKRLRTATTNRACQEELLLLLLLLACPWCYLLYLLLLLFSAAGCSCRCCCCCWRLTIFAMALIGNGNFMRSTSATWQHFSPCAALATNFVVASTFSFSFFITGVKDTFILWYFCCTHECIRTHAHTDTFNLWHILRCAVRFGWANGYTRIGHSKHF